MVVLRRSKWLYTVAGSGVVLGLFGYFQTQKKTVQMAVTNNFVPSVKWDNNWDNRDYTWSVGTGDETDPALQNKLNEKRQALLPSARRNIFLIRHGQYDLKAKTDLDKRLTKLGRQQADLVGQRLRDLNFNYTKLVRSTMTRAIETSDIILNYFPDLNYDSCDLLREGAPVRPDPPSITWNVSDEKYMEDGPRIETAFRKHFHRADATSISSSSMAAFPIASL